MFSSNLKRSVATLGVVAGVLAAAGPASAQILDGPVLAKAGPEVGSEGVKAPVPASLVDYGPGVCYFHTGKAATNAGTQVGSDCLKTPIDDMDLSIGGAEAAGFVKAPAATWTDGNNQPSRDETLAVGVRENGSQGAVKAPTFMHGDFSSVVVKAPTKPGTQVGEFGEAGFAF